ncbi:MAG: sensor histidine kinase [Myxococcales bacterium]|nr:sensor histidine kinase [Myxococcales bacterium]
MFFDQPFDVGRFTRRDSFSKKRMGGSFLLFSTLFLCLFVAPPAYPQTSQRAVQCAPPQQHIDLIETKGDIHTLEEFLQKRKDFSFQRFKARYFRPPTNTKASWLRFQFKSPHRSVPFQQWVLQLRHLDLHRVRVFFPVDLQQKMWKEWTLRRYEVDGASLQTNMPFRLAPCKQITFYILVVPIASSHWSGHLRLKVQSYRSWIKHHDLFRLLNGLYFGVLLGLLVVHFFLYLWLRDTSAKWFVLYHLSLLFFMLGGNGFLHPIFALYQWSPTNIFRMQELLLGFFILWAMLYTRSFLQTQVLPKVDRLILAYTALVIGFLLSAFVAPPSFLGRYSQILGLLSPFATIIPGWIFWRRGYPPAFIYLLAWGVFSIASFLFASPLWDDWGFLIFQVGSGISAILLSLAMVQRIRLLREDREQAERQILQAEKMATLGQLVAGVAHEVNNPVGFLTFNLPILRQYIDALEPILLSAQEERPTMKILRMPVEEFLEDSRKLLDNMEHGTSRIAKIVRDLRGYVRRQEQDQPVPSDLSSIIETILTLVGKQIEDKVQRIDVEIEPDIPKISFKEGKLEQVLINLLLNAAQAAKEEGAQISIKAYRSATRAHWIVIEVRDDGRGIPASIKNNIFSPFFTTKGREANMGLGLSISLRIIEEHGGTLHVESAEGQGACFTISLPSGESTT